VLSLSLPNRSSASWTLVRQLGSGAQDGPGGCQGPGSGFKTAIERNPRLAELAARPLLLTLMASLHAWRGGSLPEKREELYADAVDLLIDQWRFEGWSWMHPGSVGAPRKPGRVSQGRSPPSSGNPSTGWHSKPTATKPSSPARPTSFRISWSARLIEVSRNPDLKPVRLWNTSTTAPGFWRKGPGVFTFPHRTFQEYMAACHLTDLNFPKEAVSLLKADPQRWREALLLAGAKAAHGTSSAVWNLAEALCYKKPLSKAAKKGVDPECWAALLAAQTLLENEGERLVEVSEYNAPSWSGSPLAVGHCRAGAFAAGGSRPGRRAWRFWATTGISMSWCLFRADLLPWVTMKMEDARPRHEVLLPAFKIGRYPVTNARVPALHRNDRPDVGFGNRPVG